MPDIPRSIWYGRPTEYYLLLDADEVRKVGIRIYLITLAFVLFLTIGLVVGLFLSIYVLSGLWGMKKNYDEWEPLGGPVIEEPSASVTEPVPEDAR